MRDFETEIGRIHSLPEMDTALRAEIKRQRRRGHKEKGVAIRATHLMSYVLAHYFDQPPEVRDRIVDEGAATLERKRALPDPQYWDLAAGPASAPAAPAKKGVAHPGRGPRRPKARDNDGRKSG